MAYALSPARLCHSCCMALAYCAYYHGWEHYLLFYSGTEPCYNRRDLKSTTPRLGYAFLVASDRRLFNHNVSTEPADSIVTASTPLIEQKSEPAAQHEREIQPAHSQRWNWQDALYLLALVGLVVAMALHYTPHLAGEVAGEWWDPLLNMWTLSWDTTTLLHAPSHLWQAQILYPNNNSLSFSENLLGEAILFAPFYLSTHNPVLAYNITFYLTFLLCGINMYIMARHYTGKPFAA